MNPKHTVTSERLGVDTGGTFTDFVRLRAGELTVVKRRSTPADPSRAILEGLAQLGGAPEGQGLDLVHGSTVATNAVLERKGARVALLTTAGFEDVLCIGRQTRPELYNLFVAPRRRLVEASLVFGVPERLDASGRMVTPVNAAVMARLARRLTRAKVDIVAVVLLHSYANPAHELEISQQLRRAGLRVCASHEVLPEHREFERSSTTVLNAYVTPIIESYLGKLEQHLRGARLRIMQSNGGSISAAAARAQAVRTVLSGPAAGVVGARAVGRLAGFRKLISFDMGGTSTDVSLIDDVISLSNESVIDGFPVRLPMLDIHTVGAGGGSLATVDSGGGLRVGPRSAGAQPGPACYGVGEQLTVTDANLLLGRLDPENFLGGKMRLDTNRARKIARELAGRLDLGISELAEGIVRVANANMERALRVVSVQRGHDPRDFALLAFGGAGGMHACELAERLQIKTIIVPRYAGVLSAMGMLLADVTKDYSSSVLRPSDALSLGDLSRRLRPLRETARRELRAEGFSQAEQIVEPLLDVRYLGQSHELTVPFSPGYRGAFHACHQRLFGYSNPQRQLEVVNLRVKASGITHKPELPRSRARPSIPAAAAVAPARFNGRTWPTRYYRWEELSAGSRGSGPAIITSAEATVVIPPAFGFRIDDFGNAILRRGSEV